MEVDKQNNLYFMYFKTATDIAIEIMKIAFYLYIGIFMD